jgi:hypothetical protein
MRWGTSAAELSEFVKDRARGWFLRVRRVGGGRGSTGGPPLSTAYEREAGEEDSGRNPAGGSEL